MKVPKSIRRFKMKYYIIKENNIPIGFFVSETDRNKAFEEFILKSKRYGMKELREV